jgi:PHD/YefM family antitoxin component YafN of YafNO toxin-antitoxin module
MASRDAVTPVQHLPLTKARINFAAMVTRVHLKKEYVVLEKDGVPVAGVMPIDEFEDYLELQDPKVRAVIRRSRKEHFAGKDRPARDLLDELRRLAARPSKRHHSA